MSPEADLFIVGAPVWTGDPGPGLDGGPVLPGFADARVHTAAGGLELARCNLHGVEPAAYAATVATYAAAHPEAAWVLGDGRLRHRRPARGRPGRGRGRPAGTSSSSTPPTAPGSAASE